MVFSMNTAREFTNRLVDLLRNERHALAELVLALSEFDARELWKELGYPSLFPFLQREPRPLRRRRVLPDEGGPARP